jgi:hypothetical protein
MWYISFCLHHTDESNNFFRPIFKQTPIDSYHLELNKTAF